MKRDAMTRKGAAVLFSSGLFVGALALMLFQRIGQPSSSGTVEEQIAPTGSALPDQIAALRAEYDQRISVVAAENEALRADNKAFQDLLAQFRVEDPRLGTPDGNPAPPFNYQEERTQFRSSAKQRDITNLLAAGYSMDRIEYLQRRAGELAAQFRQSQTDLMNKGLGRRDPEKDLGLIMDPDFALKDEIGDVEYERYLAAVKRPTYVGVAEVLKGSVADSVGIMPGDQIVKYNNKRVFNKGQLDGLSLPNDTDIPGELVPITVRRDGQELQVMVPKGQLGVRPPLPGTNGVAVPPSL